MQLEANWVVYALIAIAVVLIVSWMLGQRKPLERSRRPDVLDEGAAPAQRNQALIDAPPAATTPMVPMPGAELMGGVGEIVAHATDEEVAAAKTPPLAPRSLEPAPVAGDDLTMIKGVGPKLDALLHSLGVTSFAQIAAWSEDDLARIDAQLGAFAGRPERDSWIEQAKLLAAGDTAGFAARFGAV